MLTSISENDNLLLRVIDQAWREAVDRSGPDLACKLGCTECCFGPFPINMLDAWRLRRGMQALPEERVRRIRLRAAGAWRRMSPVFPGDVKTGIFDEDELAEERFAEKFAHEPCPALDPQTGACELYDFRPISCRTFGPPVRIAGENLPPCRLCFQGVSEHRVNACRVEIDPDMIEEAILSDLEAEGTPCGQTIVAYVLQEIETED
ncbi:MAG: YkgJ family cysteine cluster protein [Bryobacteraceae bacterium]|nr:YkgJ family cysteine cluster protein [Bryobacteraceae bacterium]MDW8377257.1 YkgJ family cysteine cluster protein [Bryobacterales bacterium]